MGGIIRSAAASIRTDPPDMADLTYPTPNAEQLATELRELHHRREREPLSANDEARHADLLAWWQSAGGGELDGDGPEPEAHAAPAVPEEWLEAFTDGPAPEASPRAAIAADGADLVTEWEAWQAKQSAAAPFEFAADDHATGGGASYDELMSARAEALGGSEADGVELGFTPEDLAPEHAAGAEGVELEPLLEPEPEQEAESEPARAPPPVAAPARAAHGARRVVIHLADGQVLRGQVLDVEVAGDTFSYVGAGGAAESVPRGEVRTVFFMRAPGAAAPVGEGAAIRVVLRDGRELAGRSADHADGRDGFALVPDGARSTAALVWVARAAVRAIVAL
jgi:hypothetical protein